MSSDTNSNQTAQIPEDVKPRIGPIPASVPLLPPSEGKNFFKVELLVGDDRQLMRPFHQENHSDGPLSIDYYVATSGLHFSVRVKFSRPTKEGALYGARVYVDSGSASYDDVYKTWSETPNDDSTVDTSDADHYFWMDPGDTEHIINGFYKSPTESQRFEFAEPSRKRSREYENEGVELCDDLDTIGSIRIVFCKVDTLKPNRHRRNKCIPQQASIDSNLDRKIKISTKPGRIVKDGTTNVSREAVLSNEIVYERRLVYNSFEGFTARRMFYKHIQKVDFYKGMPLAALMDKAVRRTAVVTFFRNVSTARFDLTSSELAKQASEGVSITTADGGGSMIDFMRVEDIVHYLCESLSPAASYIVCTGRMKPGNYGEVAVQSTGGSNAEKFQDYCEKERGLVNFFMSEPGNFELELDGVDPKKRPKENYKVKFAVLLLDSDEQWSKVASPSLCFEGMYLVQCKMVLALLSNCVHLT